MPPCTQLCRGNLACLAEPRFMHSQQHAQNQQETLLGFSVYCFRAAPKVVSFYTSESSPPLHLAWLQGFPHTQHIFGQLKSKNIRHAWCSHSAAPPLQGMNKTPHPHLVCKPLIRCPRRLCRPLHQDKLHWVQECQQRCLCT